MKIAKLSLIVAEVEFGDIENFDLFALLLNAQLEYLNNRGGYALTICNIEAILCILFLITEQMIEYLLGNAQRVEHSHIVSDHVRHFEKFLFLLNNYWEMAVIANEPETIIEYRV